MSDHPATQMQLDPEAPEAASGAEELRVAVLRAARRLRAEKAHDDVTDAQLSVLAHLYRRGRMTPRELAERERVQPPSMTRTLACLAELNLITRTPHPDDGRQIIVELTAAGAAEINETRRRRDVWLAARLDDLDPADRDVLARATTILRRLADQ